MTFLPIVERELRTAARKPSTYRARTRFVAATSGLAALLLLIGAGQVSNALFSGLAALAFLYCWLTGVRQASDCLSEEKRDGTLGLLFLTDLRGHDVVLGKLAALLARSSQGLFAILPVLAIGLLLGGLTGGEFWRTAALLSNTLFFTLCAGLLVSAFSRESHRALLATVFILGLLIAAPLMIESLLTVSWPTAGGLIACLSPAAALDLRADVDYQGHPGRFWFVLLLNHLLGWICLLCASWVLPNSWQDRASRETKAMLAPQSTTRAPPSPNSNRALRGLVLDSNPISWLAARHDRARVLPLLYSAGAILASALLVTLAKWLGGQTFGFATFLSFMFALGLKLWVTWRACATLAEARRNGAIELLLATPLTVRDMIDGHWLALCRYFLWPLLAALLLAVVPAVETVLRQSAASNRLWLFPVPLIAVFGAVTLILDLVAAATVGMWMGLIQTRPLQAFAKTVLYVTIVPTILFCFPNVILDLFWISWARRKLEHQFRLAATRV